MARYIKANPKVAKFLNLESERNTVKDGNYLLWQNDMLKFGPLTRLSETLEQIGGIALLAYEARQEQEGTVTRSLPQATDERFIIPVSGGETQENVEEYTPNVEETESENESDNQTKEDAENE